MTPVLGSTLGFAASQQIDPTFGNISFKTDFNAIGGLIHWYLTGAPPNVGDGTDEILMGTIDRQRSNEATHFQTNAVVQAILRRSLASSPADRKAMVEQIIWVLSG